MKYAVIFLIPLLMLSCKRENMCDCFKSNSPETTVTRQLKPFSIITVNSVFDVTWKKDTSSYLILSCGKKLEKNINTDVSTDAASSEQVLSLQNNNRCNWIRSQKEKIRLEIHSPYFTELRIEVPCDFRTADTTTCETLKIDDKAGISTLNILASCSTLHFSVHSGSGDFTIRGKAGCSYYYNCGNGYFHFEDLSTGYCYFTSNTTGDSYINVSKELGVTILGYGNVYYKGNPYRIDKTEKGEGKLIKSD